MTALVLKTLCHAEKITFVDRPHLIDNGFQWLLDQINGNGTLEEKDRRLAKVRKNVYCQHASSLTSNALLPTSCIESKVVLNESNMGACGLVGSVR